jgi:hypothetical protein
MAISKRLPSTGALTYAEVQHCILWEQKVVEELPEHYFALIGSRR